MELFGVVGSAPAAFVAAAMYSLAVRWLVRRQPRAGGVLVSVSIFVLVGLVVEWILLGTAGAVRSRSIVGPAFYPTHLALFLLSIPALANILVVNLDAEQPTFWLVVGFLCALLAVPVTLTQYAVSEALYGLDGQGGPVGAQ